jgi:hypothetical protein
MEGKRKFFLPENRVESWNIVVFGKIILAWPFRVDITICCL